MAEVRYAIERFEGTGWVATGIIVEVVEETLAARVATGLSQILNRAHRAVPL